jgi:hypothetical protein
LEDGGVRTFGIVFLVRKARRLLEHINDIMVRVVDGGLLTYINNRSLDKEEAESKHIFSNVCDANTTSIKYLQKPLYLLLLGYVWNLLAL